MKTVNQAIEYAKANPTEVQVAANVVGTIIGAAIGMKVRKNMYDAGMIKSFWFPCMIKKPGTYTRHGESK